jgi:ceramide glucosyltransferase
MTRWARTIRLCRPAGYYATIVQHGFSLLTLRLLAAGPDALGLSLLGALWAAKALSAASIAGRLGGRQNLKALALLPLSEWISFGAWVAACGSDTVLWRGELFVIRSRGLLQPAEAPLRPSRPLPVER